MRPLNTKHSALQAPLDEILGYKAHVRILRCLIEAQQPMGYGELARRTGVTPQGVHKAVDRLFRSGMLSYTGSGKQQQLRLRHEHPLTNPITSLIEAEKEYFQNLIAKLKEVAGATDNKLKSAWIYGSVARGTDEYGDPLRIGVLADLKQVDDITQTFQRKLSDDKVERNRDVTIEIIGFSKADLEVRPEVARDPIILLYGPHPQSFLDRGESQGTKTPRHKDHHELETKTRGYARAYARLIEQYPEILIRTTTYLENNLDSFLKPERKEMEEWLHILTSMSQQRLRKFLLSDTERAKRLLQSNPLWHVINKHERMELERASETYE